ncbi:hypothetical protein JCM3774_000969 [Rhodotorula dairenensis]
MIPAPSTPTRVRVVQSTTPNRNDDDDGGRVETQETTPQQHRRGADKEPAPPSSPAERTHPTRTERQVLPDRDPSPSTAALRKPLHTPPILLPNPAASFTSSSSSAGAAIPQSTDQPPQSPHHYFATGSISDSISGATRIRERRQQRDTERTERPEGAERGGGGAVPGSRSGPTAPPRTDHRHPVSHPLAHTASTDSTFSSSSAASSSSSRPSRSRSRSRSGAAASSSSSCSASASENENAWAHAWIDPTNDDDDDDAAAAVGSGSGSGWDPAPAGAFPGADHLAGDAMNAGAAAAAAVVSDDPTGADQSESQPQSGERTEGAGGDGGKTRERVWFGSGAAVEGPYHQIKQDDNEEAEAEERPDDAAAEEMTDSTSATKKPKQSSARRTDGGGGGGGGGTTPPLPSASAIELPTIEPLFSSSSSSSAAAAAAAARSGPAPPRTAPIAEHADDPASVPREEERGGGPPPSVPSRPLSEFDWAAAYADGGIAAVPSSPSPPLVTPASTQTRTAMRTGTTTTRRPEADNDDIARSDAASSGPNSSSERLVSTRAPRAASAEVDDAASLDSESPAIGSAPVSADSRRTDEHPQQTTDARPSSSAALVSLAGSNPTSRSGGTSSDGGLASPALPPAGRPSGDLGLGPASGTGETESVVDGAGLLPPLSRSGTASPPDSAPQHAATMASVPSRQPQQERAQDEEDLEVEEQDDPMAMFDSLIFHSESAARLGFSEPIAPVPAAASTPRLLQVDTSAASSLSSPAPTAPEPFLATGPSASAFAGSAMRAASPAGAIKSNGTGTGGKRERGPAPVIPVKSSRRASLLGRRRQSDTHALLQRAASSSASVATASSATAGTGARSPPGAGEGTARTSPSRTRSGSVPPLSGSPAGSEPVLVSSMGRAPSGTGTATSPTPSRNSSSYDFAEIADVYARNSLYYPSPDATPRSSRMLDSEALPTAGLAEDAATSSGTVTARQSRIEPAVVAESHALPPSNTGDVGSSPTRSGDSARAAAKARAAAFIEDLKRAKESAAASVPIGANVDDTGQTYRNTVGVTLSDLSARPELTMQSPDRTPPLPPPPSAKRPADLGLVYSSDSPRPASVALPRSTTNLSLASPSRRSSIHALASFGPQTVPEPRPRLLRRRPLPQAVIIAADLKQARTSRERCRVYADKLNELAKEQSRLDEWILATSDVRRLSREPPEFSGTSPKRSRWARQESSVATFAPRGDGHRAREITRGTFSRHDLSPSAPFPGVLNLTPTRSSSHTSLAGSVALGSGKSFLSGLGRGTLGRRMSKRDHGGPPSSSSRSSAKSSLRATISGPVQVLSSTNTGLAAVSDGPYRPIHSSAGARASFDSRRSSPATSPQASRASFSFGGGSSAAAAASSSLPPSASSASSSSTSFGVTSIPTFQVTRGSVYYENGDKTAGSQVGDLDDEKLDRLADILPQASRAELATALDAAGGDDVLAISVYLSSESSESR